MLFFTILGFALSEARNRWRRRPSKGRHPLNLVLSAKAFDELKALAKQRNATITESIRLGLSLYRLVVEATEKNQKIVVTTAESRAELKFEEMLTVAPRRIELLFVG